jgi:hypothetical protein
MRPGRSGPGGHTDCPALRCACRLWARFACKVAPASGFFDRRFPRHLQFRTPGVTDELLDRLVSDGSPLVLPPPLPDRFVTGEASRVGQALAKGLRHRWGEEGRLAWGFGHGAQLQETSGCIRGQPAPHGITTAPEQVGHLTPGASLRGLEEREGLQALVCLGIVLGAEARFQFLGRLADRRKGRFPGVRLHSERMAS